MTLLPVGTRVRLKGTCRVGEIISHEYKESGVLSTLPYRVRWDDIETAGIWPCWPAPETIEEVSPCRE